MATVNLLQVSETKFLKTIDVKQMLLDTFGTIEKYHFMITTNPDFVEFFDIPFNWYISDKLTEEVHNTDIKSLMKEDRSFIIGTTKIDGSEINIIVSDKYHDIAVIPIEKTKKV